MREVCDWFRAHGVDDIGEYRSVFEDVAPKLPVELRRAERWQRSFMGVRARPERLDRLPAVLTALLARASGRRAAARCLSISARPDIGPPPHVAEALSAAAGRLTRTATRLAGFRR